MTSRIFWAGGIAVLGSAGAVLARGRLDSKTVGEANQVCSTCSKGAVLVVCMDIDRKFTNACVLQCIVFGTYALAVSVHTISIYTLSSLTV